MSAAVVADSSTDRFRYCVQIGKKLIDALALQFGCLFQGGVQVRHICVMVPVMVNLHRQCVDVRFKSVVRIRKCR
ncbi:hypothetical protein D3C74_357180 [compost metagenome]